MPDFDILRINEHRKTIESNLQELEALRGKAYEDFVRDARTLAATKYWLQTAVQSLIDIASHICARLRLKVVTDSGECVRALERQGLIPPDRATMYVKMIRFRNVLVHLYGEVDNPTVYDIVENRLDYFRMFLMDVDAMVARTQEQKAQKRVEKKRATK